MEHPREQNTLTSGQAIRDTNYWTSPVIDGRGYSKKAVHVVNGLNQAITDVVVEVSYDNGSTWKYGQQLSTNVSASTGAILSLVAPIPMWRVKVKCTTAPTSGNVEIYTMQWMV